MLLFCYFTLLEQVNETGAEGVSTVIWWMWLTPFIGQWMISLSGRVNLITSMAEISRKELNAITQRLVSAQTGDYDWYTDTPSIPRHEQNRRRLLHRLRWYQISLDKSSCHAKETPAMQVDIKYLRWKCLIYTHPVSYGCKGALIKPEAKSTKFIEVILKFFAFYPAHILCDLCMPLSSLPPWRLRLSFPEQIATMMALPSCASEGQWMIVFP